MHNDHIIHTEIDIGKAREKERERVRHEEIKAKHERESVRGCKCVSERQSIEKISNFDVY